MPYITTKSWMPLIQKLESMYEVFGLNELSGDGDIFQMKRAFCRRGTKMLGK